MIPSIDSLPIDLAVHVADAIWKPILIGQSGASVYRLTRRGEASRYLKRIGRGEAAAFEREAAVLEWLGAQRMLAAVPLAVPRVLLQAQDARYSYLLQHEVPGVNAADAFGPLRGEALARALGRTLRVLHALDPQSCPFDQRLTQKLQLAKERVDGGFVDESDFDAPRAGWPAIEVWREAVRLCPLEEDLVVTHGDFTLPNVILGESGVTGCVDWGRAGVADRYQDLALAIASLRDNGAEDGIGPFCEEYGIDALDYGKLEFYHLLDELF